MKYIDLVTKIAGWSCFFGCSGLILNKYLTSLNLQEIDQDLLSIEETSSMDNEPKEPITLNKSLMSYTLKGEDINENITSPIYIDEHKPITHIQNAFIARIKTITGNIKESNPSFSCSLKDGIEQTCNVFRFTSPQTTNNLTKINISQDLTNSPEISNELTQEELLVIELGNANLSITQLNNQTIYLKSLSNLTHPSDIATLNYDQPLIKITEELEDQLDPITYFLPLKQEVETYITSINLQKTIDSPYSCIFKSIDSSIYIDNIDDSCRLIEIPEPSDEGQMVPFNTVLSSSKSPLLSDLEEELETFYKLEIDKNKLYNLDFEANTGSSPVLLSIIQQGNPNIEYGTLELTLKIADSSLIGQTDWLIAKYESANSPTINLTSKQISCGFTETKDIDDFDCLHYADKYKNTLGLNKASLTTFVVNESPHEEDITYIKGKYYAIRLPNKKNIDELTLNKDLYLRLMDISDKENSESYRFTIYSLFAGFVDVSEPKTFYISDTADQQTPANS